MPAFSFILHFGRGTSCGMGGCSLDSTSAAKLIILQVENKWPIPRLSCAALGCISKRMSESIKDIYIYIYIYMYIYICYFIYIYIYIYVYVYIHIYIYRYMYLSLSLYIYIYIYMCLFVYVVVFVLIHIRISYYMCLCVCVVVFVFVSLSLYLFVYLCCYATLGGVGAGSLGCAKVVRIGAKCQIED